MGYGFSIQGLRRVTMSTALADRYRSIHNTHGKNTFIKRWIASWKNLNPQATRRMNSTIHAAATQAVARRKPLSRV